MRVTCNGASVLLGVPPPLPAGGPETWRGRFLSFLLLAPQLRCVQLDHEIDIFSCVSATCVCGNNQEVYNDFVTTTFLGDRKTTIKQYIDANPSVMSELPPPHLINRYNG